MRMKSISLVFSLARESAKQREVIARAKVVIDLESRTIHA